MTFKLGITISHEPSQFSNIDKIMINNEDSKSMTSKVSNRSTCSVQDHVSMHFKMFPRESLTGLELTFKTALWLPCLRGIEKFLL